MSMYRYHREIKLLASESDKVGVPTREELIDDKEVVEDCVEILMYDG